LDRKIQLFLHCTPETVAAPFFPPRAPFAAAPSLLFYGLHPPDFRETQKRLRLPVADTTKIEDTQERKKLKRAARKKAAPKAKRTEPRGSAKKKVKKMARGISKR
jgi:hypothetical protein